MSSQTVYIGTYTEKLPFVDGKAEGIRVSDAQIQRRIGNTHTDSAQPNHAKRPPGQFIANVFFLSGFYRLG